MKLFTYAKVTESPEAAVKESGTVQNRQSSFIAGGTNLIDLMKGSILEPDHLVDITGLKLAEIKQLSNGRLLIGALARNTDAANHPVVRKSYPLLSRALLSGASPQLRNMATVGGNILQRTRCLYFYDTASKCNKRNPASGCDAIEGYNRMNAILGGSNNCIAVHPSDMCVALACLDAVVHVLGPDGERQIRFVDFHKVPGDTPQIETALKEHELITAVELPAQGFAKNWCYLKVRDRSSFAFALVSAAVTLQMDGSTIRSASIALGGVATKPWRAADAEQALKGKSATENNFKQAAELIMKSALARTHNEFKIELGKRTVVRALKIAAGMST